MVKIGDELEVKILRVDTDSRKIGLSLRRVQWAAEDKEKEAAEGGASEPVKDIEPPVERRAPAVEAGCEVAGVDLPFDRFYMNETVAPEVEAALWARGDEPVRAWLAVRVLGGRAVPEELYLDGIPAREFLEREARSRRTPGR